MKTIYALTLIVFTLSAFSIGCSGGSGTTSVTIDLSGSSAVLASGMNLQAGTAVIPDSLSSIRIDVYDNEPSSGTLIADSLFTSEQAKKGMSLDVQAGSHRYFRATASTTGAAAPAVYSGSAGPVDLQADTDITVTLALSKANIAKDAELRIIINNASGTTFTPADYGTVVAASFEEGVYIPTMTTDANGKQTLDLNESTPVAKAASLGTDLTVYPQTFQLLLVKVFAYDGAVSLLGGAVVSSLSSGKNTVTITMDIPAKIRLTLQGYAPVPGDIVTVTETFTDGTSAPTDAVLSAKAWTANPTDIKVYSGVNRYSSPTVSVYRTITAKVTTGTGTMYYATQLPIPVFKWKTTDLLLLPQ